MRINVFRKGFNYSQDGPGNRLVYHLQGCTMRCGWCSNPEGIDPKGTLLVTPNLLLDSVCPHGAIAGKVVDRERCARCAGRECVGVNRNQAIHFSSQSCALEALVDEAKRSAALFYDGGGVTLSGGEATLQFSAVRRLLQRLKDEAIATALETNATHARLGELLPLIDDLIIDVKHHDDRRLKEATGVGLRVVEGNVARALAEHPRVLIRMTLIAGFNAAPDDAQRFADFFRRYDTGNARFEFIAYHDYGRAKWAQCAMPYRIDNGFVTEDVLAHFAGVFAANGLRVVRT